MQEFAVMLSEMYQISIPAEFFYKSGRDTIDDYLRSFNQEMIDSDNHWSELNDCNREFLEEKPVESEPLEYAGNRKKNMLMN